MTPTNKLRFVERNEPVILNGERFDNWQKVLQQWFAPFHTFNDGYGYTSMELKGGEWRDVPTEKEQA